MRMIAPLGNYKEIMCVFYGAGGLLHEAQLLELLVQQLNPSLVRVRIIEEQYAVYLDEHDMRHTEAHALQGACPCGHITKSTPLVQIIWTARLENYMGWYTQCYPSIAWVWELAQEFPRQLCPRQPVDDAMYQVCFVVDGNPPQRVPPGYTTFTLTTEGIMLVNRQLTLDFPLMKKHSSIKYIRRY